MAPDTPPLYPNENLAATARWTGVYRSVHQTPRPPTERGWVPTTGTPIQNALGRITQLRQQEFATAGLLRALDRAIAESRQARDVDRTFENEMRLQ